MPEAGAGPRVKPAKRIESLSGSAERSNDERFRVIFDSVYDGILVIAADTYEFIDANARICEIFGYARAEMLGLNVSHLSADVSDAALLMRAAYRDRATAGEAFLFEWECVGKSQSRFWCEIAVSRAVFERRDVFLLTAQDITARRAAQAGMASRDRILHAITLSVADLVELPSLEEAMSHVFRAVGEALDVDRLSVLQATLAPSDVVVSPLFVWQRSPDLPTIHTVFGSRIADVAELAAWLAPLALGEPVISYAEEQVGFPSRFMGELQAQAILMVPIDVEGRYWGYVGVDDSRSARRWSSVEIEALEIFARVIGALVAQREARALIERMARFDVLTGLPNRRLFIEALEKAISRQNRYGEGFAVLYLDLDHFKDVNDTLGHPVGDVLLQRVAERLHENVRDIDTISRFGGDEFAAVAIDIRDPSDAATLAEKLVRALDRPFDVDGRLIQTGTCIGIAVYGPESPDAEALLSHADVALYRAKADGVGTYRFYTDAMDADVRARVALGAELAAAVKAEQFGLVYQPQIDLRSGRIVGLEALVRWNHPTRGLLRPASFIVAAEASGAIVPMGRIVLREACLQMRAWMDAGIAPPVITVNVSGIQFRQPGGLEDTLTGVLAESRVPAARVEIELTESVLMEASRSHNAGLLRLRDMGLRIAIDDFGTGYSSLDYLRRFQVQRIKIPGTFITDLTTIPSNGAIVRASFGLARELDIEVVIEGVETVTQIQLLEAWGGRIVQGFYFSEPLAVADATALLRVGVVGPAPASPAARELVAERASGGRRRARVPAVLGLVERVVDPA
jgi:diguanylate cyclase (GGDEF)-like protein/PAS domain S-box-containing protein